MPHKDPERRREYGRDWMRRNADKAREAMRRWRQRNPDDHNAASREFYRRHRERVIARSVAYHRAHPDVRRATDARRRGAPGSFTSAQWKALVDRVGGRCGYCGGAGPLHADHRVPIARGGTNDIGNILPACARCNLRKHTMSEESFRELLAFEAKVRVEWTVEFTAEQVRALLAEDR